MRDWKDKFEENQEGLIVLNTYQQVEDLIDLLDERYTRSDVTNQEYDTDVKRVAKPVWVNICKNYMGKSFSYTRKHI